MTCPLVEWSASTPAVITAGVDADHSTSGQVMPPRGGSRLTDAQVRQVAAYVLHLHRKPLAPS